MVLQLYPQRLACSYHYSSALRSTVYLLKSSVEGVALSLS